MSVRSEKRQEEYHGCSCAVKPDFAPRDGRVPDTEGETMIFLDKCRSLG